MLEYKELSLDVKFHFIPEILNLQVLLSSRFFLNMVSCIDKLWYVLFPNSFFK